MALEADIQDSKYLNKIKAWIPAFAGMTPRFLDCDTASKERGLEDECITFFEYAIFIACREGFA